MAESVCAVIVAAGTGSRMGAGMNKVYLPLGEKCVLRHCVEAFVKSGVADEYVIVTGAEDFAKCREALAGVGVGYTMVEGGATRSESVMRGISAAKSDFAAVHDGARAVISPELIRDTVAAAVKYGAAAPGVVPKDTPKEADSEGFIARTIARDGMRMIQTPQVFVRSELISAHRKAASDGAEVTDDCMVMEIYSDRKIKLVQGSYENIKLTTPEDMYTAQRILEVRSEKK